MITSAWIISTYQSYDDTEELYDVCNNDRVETAHHGVDQGHGRRDEDGGGIIKWGYHSDSSSCKHTVRVS